MIQEPDAANETVDLKLTGSCTIDRVMELKEELEKGVNDHRALTLDVSGVTAMDVSFLQLLCRIHWMALKNNGQVTLHTGDSDVFTNVSEEAGFARPAGCCSEHAENCLWAAVSA